MRWIRFAVLAAIAVGAVLRIAHLQVRPFHNDEGVNAVKFGQVWQTGGYHYDPAEYHGPALEYFTWMVEKLSGSPPLEQISNFRLRLVPVLFGLGLIALLPLVRDGLGRIAIVFAAFLTAVSPALVFYSADYIHESLLTFFTFLFLAAGWRYWRSRRLAWAILAGTSAGLMCATKETFVLQLAAVIAATLLNQIWNRKLDASGVPVKAAPINKSHVAAGFFAAGLVVILFYSAFFTNASGLPDVLRTYLPWLKRAGGQSPHILPWDFYFHRLLWFHVGNGPVWSEAFILVLALVGAGAAFARKGVGDGHAGFWRFLSLFFSITAIIYSVISYKTPWCLLGFWHSAILMAGAGAAVIYRIARLQWARAAVVVLAGIGMTQLAAQAWLATGKFASDPRNPYVYAQTLPDVTRLVAQIKAISSNSPSGKNLLLKVIVPSGDYWPLPWELREFKNAGWYDVLPAEPYGEIMVVGAGLQAKLDEQQTHAMVGYFELRPRVFLELYVDAQLWRKYVASRPAAAPAD
jgi:uncharacterized protein (TIGR03663 family)